MDNQLMLIIVVAILVIIFAAVGAWVYMKSIRSRRLKAKFGPEYDQTVERLRNRELAETELQDRERRVKRDRCQQRLLQNWPTGLPAVSLAP